MSRWNRLYQCDLYEGFPKDRKQKIEFQPVSLEKCRYISSVEITQYKYELNKSEEDKLKEEIENIYKDEPNNLYILFLISINNWYGINAAKKFMIESHIPIISKPKLKQQEQYVKCNNMEFYK